mmetsp:Transcript_48817/g.136655  ORF Transcript_48817/g.136655 Transcript_48817/m.136655 type:complete len:271 (+) Transcript_48817:1148-1960(+)
MLAMTFFELTPPTLLLLGLGLTRLQLSCRLLTRQGLAFGYVFAGLAVPSRHLFQLFSFRAPQWFCVVGGSSNTITSDGCIPVDWPVRLLRSPFLVALAVVLSPVSALPPPILRPHAWSMVFRAKVDLVGLGCNPVDGPAPLLHSQLLTALAFGLSHMPALPPILRPHAWRWFFGANVCLAGASCGHVVCCPAPWLNLHFTTSLALATFSPLPALLPPAPRPLLWRRRRSLLTHRVFREVRRRRRHRGWMSAMPMPAGRVSGNRCHWRRRP